MAKSAEGGEMTTIIAGEDLSKALDVRELGNVVNEVCGKHCQASQVVQAIYELCRQVHEAADRICSGLEERKP